MLKFFKEIFKRIFYNQRDLTWQELKDIKELNRLCLVERFKANQIKNNTVYFKNGPTFAAQQEALANLLLGIKEQTVAKKLQECGYPANQQCSINLESGEIVKVVMPVAQEVAVPQMNKK